MTDTARVETGNFFLDGNFAPVDAEIDAQDMAIEGAIPTDLSGNFIRVGPNPAYISDVDKYHTFDGDGMIHSIEFADGTARYRNRFVQTEGLLLERERDDWIWKGLNSMLDPTPSRVPEGSSANKNLANTAFAYHNNTLYALHEGSAPTVISLPNLETEGTTDFDGKLNHPFTAHPKVDHKTGEMMTFGYSFEAPYVHYSVISAEGDLVHTTPVNIPMPVFMHDFAVTENYSLFLDFPITLDIERIMAGGAVLEFDASNGARIGVIPRFGNDEDVRWFDVDVGVVIHTANAWEDGDSIVIQASRSKTADIAGAGTSDNVNLKDTLGRLHEWRIDLSDDSVTERRINDVPCDFTRVNDTYACSKTRYVYAAVFNPDRPFTFSGLMKFDNDTGESEVFEFGENRFGGETIFAPKVGSAAEDDGYLICFVQDEAEDRSECLILDAQHVSNGPVAAITIPYRVPYGFHAGWVSNA
jgi:carotenoid cleavage dioxygenase-like enzyme